MAYKFYLFDPTLSSEPINNWIGPNRNDSLIEKLEKLKSKQFPLLYHPCAKSAYENIEIKEVTQALCMLASLFIPFEYKGVFAPSYAKAIKGYYLNFEAFKSLDDASKSYYIPAKKEWGMEPSENDNWTDISGVEEHLLVYMKEEQAPLIWQKQNDSFLAFFIVWW